MTTYHLSLSVFMTNMIRSGFKKHRESTEPESHHMSNYFYFSSKMG